MTSPSIGSAAIDTPGPLLFEPITLRGLQVANRMWLSAMCQYAVERQDGVPTDWQFVHLGSRAVGGFGLIMTESTAVSPEGRSSLQDTGLWNESQVAGWRRIVDFVHSNGSRIGIQLGHAGRKSSTYTPWLGSGSVPTAEGGWTTMGPSAIAFGQYATPRAMALDEIDAVVMAFARSAALAVRAGFDAVEVHAAHGYLAHQFLSPLANHRNDEYGGSFENRTRFLLRVVAGIRSEIPDELPLMVRLSATDWVEGGWDIEETVQLSALLTARGVDLIDTSSGGLDPRQQITVAPGYQVKFAESVRRGATVATGAVGLITEPAQAEQILQQGSADVVLLARAALREPAWPLRAAHELGVPASKAPYPPAYLRGAWR